MNKLNGDFKIVEMDFKHIDSVLQFERFCFALPQSKKTFIDELKNENAYYFCAVYNEKVLGYIGFWKILNEAEIINLAVHPEFRNLGIATELIKKIIYISETEKIDQIFLEVRVSNITAKNLYKKFNFNEVGLRKRYYSDNSEDAVIMSRRS